MFTLRIPGLPPSTNNAFITAGHRRALSEDAAVWKQGVQLATLCTRQKAIQGLLEVSLTFYSQKWLTKSGKPRRIDVANLEKLFVDAVFHQLGMDDSNIWKLTLRKMDGPEESVIRIIPLTDLTPG